MDLLVSLQEESSVLKERVKEILMKTNIITSIAQPSRKAQERRIPVEKESNWVESQKAMLIGVAIVIASMATSFVVNPPGGVWDDAHNNTIFCTPSSPCISGMAVSSYVRLVLFQEFIKNNCICVVFSICAILLLLCGFSFYKRAIVWIYTVLMCLALFFWNITFYLVDSSSAICFSSLDIKSFTGRLLALIWITFSGLVIFLVLLGKIVHKKMRKPAAKEV